MVLAESGNTIRVVALAQAHRLPSHISKTVLSTVPSGPPKRFIYGPLD